MDPESLTKQPFKLTRFLKMGIYKSQNSLATAAEFASTSKARGKERIPDIVINCCKPSVPEPKAIGCGRD